MEFLDFGSSDSEEEEEITRMPTSSYDFNSDSEEEKNENKRLLKLLSAQDPPTKTQRNIQDFEAEMEAELDRRAFEIESQGGMEHQASLSRSSSTLSLNRSPRASPIPEPLPLPSTCASKKSNLKKSDSSVHRTKSVKFSEKPVEINSTQVPPMPSTSEDAHISTTLGVENEYDALHLHSDRGSIEPNRGTASCNTLSNRESKKRLMDTDDDLFYDPLSDANDQAWIDDQRRKSYGQNVRPAYSCSSGNVNSTNSANLSPKSDINNKDQLDTLSPNSLCIGSLPTTDAILNCPACFTTVCLDCQRHELYVGQYRAMFVVNCHTNRNETLSIPEKAPKKFRKRKKENHVNFTPNSTSDTFYPVLCTVCKTQVAMYDSEEVYHFFNVLASQP